MARDYFEEMAERWDSPFVLREDVPKFCFNLLKNPQSLAVLDAKGKGPPKVKFGQQKVAYGKHDLADWLRERYGGEDEGMKEIYEETTKIMQNMKPPSEALGDDPETD